MSEQDGLMELAAGFPAVSRDEWRASVDKALRGADFEKTLVTNLYEGFSVGPIYRNGDTDAGPGVADFVGGEALAARVNHGWDIRQTVAHPDPETANTEALEELERGAVSLTLRLDRSGEAGVMALDSEGMATLLRGLYLDMACVGLDAGADFEAATATFLAVAEQNGVAKDKLLGHLNADPLQAVARGGIAPDSLDAALAHLDGIATHIAEHYPKMKAVGVSTAALYEAGLDEAEDLGAALASGLIYLKALTRAGLSLDEAAGQLVFRLSLGTDQFMGIAKLRAFRRLWARVIEASGGSATTATVYADLSLRVMTRRDPWVNMLRATVATFAGTVGGADGVTIAPFDAALGLPDGFSRRIARNAQVVLMEESSLGRVVDPASGSWYVEDLTNRLAEAAWKQFQAIEAAGGMVEALKSGVIADMADTSWNKRAKNLARRKDAVTGVSEFPHLHEEPVVPGKPDLAALRSVAANRVAGKETVSGGNFADLVSSVLVGKVAGPPTIATGAAMPVRRFAGEFETLRDTGDASGERPAIFIANLGTPADYTARTTFARNMFEAGGIEGRPAEVDAETAAAAFRDSGARLAIICSSDSLYADQAVAVAEALKSAGTETIWLAGRAGDNEAAWHAAGIERYVYMGCPVLDELRFAAKTLGGM